MSERSSDIEFDFFDEPETEEAPARTRRTGRGGPRRPVRPPAGLTPILRLAGLFAFIIAAIVVLVLVIQGCRADAKRDAYSAYMQDVRGIARRSDAIGRDLNRALTTAGITQAELESQLNALAQRQAQGVARANELDPPGALREQHEHLEEALGFRVSGLRRLGDAFRRTAGPRPPAGAGALLTEQAQRLVASDVIWSDLFRQPAMEILERQEIGGVNVPESQFVTDPNLATERRMALVLQRIRAAATGGRPAGPHGNALVSVRALPEGKVLDPNADQNLVTATAELAFEVTIENSGGSQEVQVPVRLIVQQRPRQIVRTQTVDLIDPGQRKTVVFRNLGEAVQFAPLRIPLRVEVVPVRGETNRGNNSATYQVVFTLPEP